MKSVLLFSAIFFSALYTVAQQKTDPANFEKYAQANTTAPKGGVVFMGNSITEGWVRAHPDFFTKNNYIGRGISGQVSSQMLVRFRSDVINLKPKAVVILAGINDIAQNSGFISLDNIMGNIISMCELAKANQIKVILCSVLPAYEFKWRKEISPATDVLKLNEMILQYARAHKIVYVDYHTALKDERNGLPEKYAEDGVHPNTTAYTIMENLVKAAIDVPVKTKGEGRKYLFSKD